ncbi:S9 family peptidase [Tunturiibacter gelidoferens]|uniref:Dipeptidyl aminopeptidase/acylaminoacyl peptidase n=1 Tax=Tunturiibacter lichenicola TaxID=2051959 RepID=A0A7Y9NIT7_9BACT|nr:S9 family peptidase [Edaphobacter lichenicola]NYF50176.1 dipeptidyl aminopeptidase/acylaminoacyl peptidase [Edaphobacter lichenicola]
MLLKQRLSAVVGVVVGCCFTASGMAQGKQLTTEDYARAEKFMGYNVSSLVYHGVARPMWMGDGRFWYRDNGPDGITFMVVDPVKGTKVPGFDQAKLAAALTKATDGKMKADAQHLVISEIEFSDGDKTVVVGNGSRKFRCDLSGVGVCTEVIAPGAKASHGEQANGAHGELSPDKTKAAFIRDWNLWVREVATGKETQLTTDGVKDYGYATDNAGWTMSDNPILVWSPDGKKIATFQQDQRKTGEMYMVPVTNGHPELKAWKYPLVGDTDVTMIERVIIDVGKAKVIRLKMPPDQHRSTLCDDVSCRGGSGWDDVQWSDDGEQLMFVSTSRDHKQEWVRIADAASGEVLGVMSETASKFFESGNGKVNWKYLSKTNELLWFSERDGWGQMYLYDAATGSLKNKITRGDGNVTQVLHVDEKTRTIYFLAVAKEAGRDPYFSHFYSVKFTGKDMKLLTPENADHAVTVSQDGRYFVDVYSTATEPQTTVVRDESGKVVVEVAKQDISKLVAAGWVAPEPIVVKARDGKTDLYGYMFKPTNLDASKKYPIVNHVYPGPQTGSCGGRGFAAAHGDMQSLAELGFVVVCIDGMGTSFRSKAFHEFYFGDLGDNTIPDQVAGMKELAAKYPWIDIDKAGMYGHSGGGNATAAAMFHYPDFFKVGIAESGNHDQRDYEDDWAEKWNGLLVKNADGTTNYDSQANQSVAKNLKGKLLLAHGSMDNNVPLNNTLLVVDALIRANKDFDLLIIPNVAHGYGEASQYMTRRRWDYFVKNLAGDVPPHEYEMKSYAAAMAAMRSGPGDAEEDFDR